MGAPAVMKNYAPTIWATKMINYYRYDEGVIVGKAQKSASKPGILNKEVDPVESQWAKQLHARLVKKKRTPKLRGDVMTVLVDGDLIAYRCAAATDGVSYDVKVPMPSKSQDKNFKYHKDAMKYKEDLEEARYSGVTVTKRYDAEPEAFALQNLDKLMKTAEDNLERIYKRPLEVRVFLTSDHLFRESVSPTYKKSREGVRKPTHLKACKKHLEDKWDAETVPGYEADDMMSMLATSIGPKDCVMMTLDKDLDQIPGQHYNFVKCTAYEVTEKDGRYNFWTQVLQGDKTDDIPGLKGVGPVNAARILEECYNDDKSEHDYYKTTLAAYIAMTKREDKESDKEFLGRCIADLGRNARLLWLCREPEQLWDVPLPTKENDE